MRHFLQRYSAAILSTIVLIAVIIAVTSGVDDWALLVTAIGIALSAIYFLQSQRLEETKLFKELFTEFNERYDSLNNKLIEILNKPIDQELTSEQVTTLIDYFNLCSEEYLFYKLGYIKKEVWLAWLAGMKVYYSDERIKGLWDRDFESGSYYGFTSKHLQNAV